MTDDTYLDEQCYLCPNQAIKQDDFDLPVCRDCLDDQMAWERADDERQRRQEAC